MNKKMLLKGNQPYKTDKFEAFIIKLCNFLFVCICHKPLNQQINKNQVSGCGITNLTITKNI